MTFLKAPYSLDLAQSLTSYPTLNSAKLQQFCEPIGTKCFYKQEDRLKMLVTQSVP